MAAEVSLRSDKISEGGFFSIDVRETGAEKGVSLKTSETAVDIINKGKAVEIGFSILSSKEEDLVEEVNKVVEAGIDSIHIDHLDGNFTPGLPAFDCTWQIRKIAHIEVPLNVHLMSVAPSIELIDSLVEAGLKKGDLLLVHHESYDSFTEMEKNVRYIKERGLKAGIVINPETPIEDLQRVLEDLHGSLDAVMVMSIIPGAGSRPYIAGTEDKVRDIRRLLRVMGIRDRIKVILDGGLNQDSLASIIASGADDIITRTWLLSQKDSYRESLGYVRNLSRRRAEYICFKDMMEEWDLANYRFVIDAIAKFCSGDDTFTEEEILRTVKRYAGVNKVTIDDERVIDVFYKDKLVRFHKDEVIPIEYLGLRDRTYYDGTVVKIYTGNVMNREEGDYILGLSGSWHDSTAVLVKDGEIIAALEEERMTRQKHDPSLFPVNSILRLLEKNGITWKDIKHIALGWNFNLYVDTPHSANPNDIFFAQMDKEYAAEKGIDPEEVVRRRSAEKNKKRFNVERVYEFLRAMSETFNVDHEPKVSFVSHSRSHAASAYYTCGFKGKVLTLALDGYGDRESGSVWLCEDGRMEELARFRLPHSIGWMWCAVTEYLGFKPSAEEGQVMGFAPYGEPWDSVEMARVNKLREIFKDYMRFDPETQTLVSNPENY
jgi:ribulose-phosphate 3-epimerase